MLNNKHKHLKMTLINRKNMAALYDELPGKYPEYKIYSDGFKAEIKPEPAKEISKKRGRK